MCIIIGYWRGYTPLIIQWHGISSVIGHRAVVYQE